MMNGMNVLVVEDNIDIGNLYSRLLTGHTVTNSTNGANANLCLQSQRFDLIILDMHIGEISGLEILRNVRNNEIHQSTPIMVISADDSLRLAAREIGIDFWMNKPIDIDQMVDYLQTVSQVLQ
jgi:DNA-binding response OmpR family regulator